MPVSKIDEEALERAAQILRSGRLVAFPTETVYGLGGDARNPEALAKIFSAKGRPRFDPLIVHIAEPGALGEVADLDALDARSRQRLQALAETLWPGALTLVLPKNAAIPDLVSGGLSTVAARLPDHAQARRLIELSGGAIAAPSANPFGRLSPTLAHHVDEALGSKVALILDGGPCRIGVESTVLDVSEARILRPGGVSREAIESVIGPVSAGASLLDEAERASPALPSPGLLASHYAPRRDLAAHSGEAMRALSFSADRAYLFFDGASREAWISGPGDRGAVIETLSETGDDIEAAARLFQALHSLDAPDVAGINGIHAQLAPERGLGLAINDRLRRAARGKA
ncbi:MAG: L-threonylcarbamoyladenylate synthase [Treponema sp.]|nr:L-threonylcarbamoyladenylate synthase [Treponema sp.]